MLRSGPSTLAWPTAMQALRHRGLASSATTVRNFSGSVSASPSVIRRLGAASSRSPLRLHLTSSPTRSLSSTPAWKVENPQVTNPTSIPQQTRSNPGEADKDAEQDGGGPQPTGAYARFKLLAKKYGWYAFGMYWILSTVDFTLTFVVVHSLGAERIEPVISSSLRTYRLWRHGEEETAKLEQQDKQRREEVKREESQQQKGGRGYWGSRMFWAEALLAYTIHKTALLPFRAGLTVAWTPKVVKWLRARGWAGKDGTSRAFAHAQSKLKRKTD